VEELFILLKVTVVEYKNFSANFIAPFTNRSKEVFSDLSFISYDPVMPDLATAHVPAY
jgi:hypothetical protein